MRCHEQRSVCANCLRQRSRRSGIARQHGADICWVSSRLDIWLRCRGDKLQPMKAYLPIALYCCNPAFIKHPLVWSRHNNSLQSQAPVSRFQSKKQHLLPVHAKPTPHSDNILDCLNPVTSVSRLCVTLLYVTSCCLSVL